MVHERELHILARTEVRRTEHHGEVAVDQAAEPSEQLVGMPRDLHALHRQLVVHLPAHAHDGHVGGALARAEAHVRGLRVQARRGDARPLRAAEHVVMGVRHVVEKRPRLDERGKRVGGRVVAERGGGVVQVGQKRVGAVEAQTPLHLLEHLAQRGVRRGGTLELLARPRQTRLRAGELHDRIDARAGKRGDGLPGRGHDAADLLQLVAEEVQAHRIGEVAGEHVHGAAAHGERAGAVELPGVDVAALLERADEVAELGHARRLRTRHVRKLAPGLERDGQKRARARGRQRAQKRPSARHHDGLPARRERMRRLHAARHLGRIARLGGEGEVRAFGEAQDALLSQVGREAARERRGRVLARHHRKRRLGPVREPRGDEERPRRTRHAERRVLPRVEPSPERVEAARPLERKRERVDEHEGPLPKTARRKRGCPKQRPSSTKSRESGSLR